MDKKHKKLSLLLLLSSFIIFYWFEGKITEVTSQNLVTFFSIVFGFYMTSLAVFYNASFTKSLYRNREYDKNGKRGIHRLKAYFLYSGYWSIISIASVILFTFFSNANEENVLTFVFDHVNIPFTAMIIDLNLALVSLVLGISVVNIFFMLLMLHTLLDAMVEEAKSE